MLLALPTRESCSFRLSRRACTAGLLGNSRCDSVNSFISTEGGDERGEAKEQHKVRQLLSVPHWTTVERQCNSTSLSIASFQLGIEQLAQLAQTLSRRVDLTRQLCCSRPSESTEYSSVCINTDLGNTTLFFFSEHLLHSCIEGQRACTYTYSSCVCAPYIHRRLCICIHKTTEKHGPVSARNGRLNARKAGEVFAPIFYFVVVVVVCVCLLTLSGVNYSLDTHTQKTGAAYMC